MQKKIGTVVDEDLLKRVKAAASAEHTTLNHLFEEALSQYLERRRAAGPGVSNVEASFGALKLPRALVRRISQEDPNDAF